MRRAIRPATTVRALRIQPYLAADTGRWFVGYRESTGLSETDAVNTIFRHSMGRERQLANDRAILFQRLDRITRILEKILLVLNLIGECLWFVFRFIFGFMSDLSTEERKKRQQAASVRVEELIRHVVERFDRGERFIEDMTKQLRKDDDVTDEGAIEDTTGDQSTATTVVKR
jgi:hypothetical protein